MEDLSQSLVVLSEVILVKRDELAGRPVLIYCVCQILADRSFEYDYSHEL